MRQSRQICDVFSPFVAQKLPLIPVIIITPPVNRAPRPEPRIIKRWTGLADATRNMTLQLPSQGVTKGARLALARKGLATGSYRLNCAETHFSLDENGHCLYERMDLDEELETSRHGLMEKPPSSDFDMELENERQASKQIPLNRRSNTTRKFSQGGFKSRNDVRWLFSDFRSGSPKKKAQNFATLSGSSGLGDLAYSRTFSEGLCSLAGSESPTLTEKPMLEPSSSLRSLLSAIEIGKRWFDSLTEKHIIKEEETSSLKLYTPSVNADNQFIKSSISISPSKSQKVYFQDDPFVEGGNARDDGCTFNWQLNRSGQKPTTSKKMRRTSSASSMASNIRRSLLCNGGHGDITGYDDSEILLSGSITIAGGLCLFAQEELSLTKFLAQSQNYSMHNDAVELAFS